MKRALAISLVLNATLALVGVGSMDETDLQLDQKDLTNKVKAPGYTRRYVLLAPRARARRCCLPSSVARHPAPDSRGGS